MPGPDMLDDLQIAGVFASVLETQETLPILDGVLNEVDGIVHESPIPVQSEIAIEHANELGEHVAYGRFRKTTTIVTNIEDSAYTKQTVTMSGVMHMDDWGDVSIRSLSRRVYKPEKVNLYSQEDFLT